MTKTEDPRPLLETTASPLANDEHGAEGLRDKKRRRSEKRATRGTAQRTDGHDARTCGLNRPS